LRRDKKEKAGLEAKLKKELTETTNQLLFTAAKLQQEIDNRLLREKNEAEEKERKQTEIEEQKKLKEFLEKELKEKNERDKIERKKNEEKKLIENSFIYDQFITNSINKVLSNKKHIISKFDKDFYTIFEKFSKKKMAEIFKLYNTNISKLIEIEAENKRSLQIISDKYDRELWEIELYLDKSNKTSPNYVVYNSMIEDREGELKVLEEHITNRKELLKSEFNLFIENLFRDIKDINLVDDFQNFKSLHFQNLNQMLYRNLSINQSMNQYYQSTINNSIDKLLDLKQRYSNNNRLIILNKDVLLELDNKRTSLSPINSLRDISSLRKVLPELKLNLNLNFNKNMKKKLFRSNSTCIDLSDLELFK